MKKRHRNRTHSFSVLTHSLLITGAVLIGTMIILPSIFKPGLSFNWEGIRLEVKDTVKRIEKYNHLSSGVVGIAGKTPQQWYRRIWLEKYATENELKKLMKYPNGAVKATVFESYIRRSKGNNYELIKQALNDTTTFFYYSSGCTGQPMMLGEYIIENVIHISDQIPPSSSSITKDSLGMTNDEIRELMRIYTERKAKKREFYDRMIGERR